MRVYFISGQAADEKIFENLTLPSYVTIKHVQWIEPLDNETFTNYCKRLANQIDTSQDFVLVGVSFGGIVSVELNKILFPKQTIIISSVATRGELRPLLKFIGYFRIHKIVPPSIYKWYSPMLAWYFGAKTEREKEVLRLYAKSASRTYMRWAVNEILKWKNEERPENLFHIHGTDDKIFPHQYTNADFKIMDGTHLMVHNRAQEISKLLADILNVVPH